MRNLSSFGADGVDEKAECRPRKHVNMALLAGDLLELKAAKLAEFRVIGIFPNKSVLPNLVSVSLSSRSHMHQYTYFV